MVLSIGTPTYEFSGDISAYDTLSSSCKFVCFCLLPWPELGSRLLVSVSITHFPAYVSILPLSKMDQRDQRGLKKCVVWGPETWQLSPSECHGAMATVLYLKTFWKFPQAPSTWVGPSLGNLSIIFPPESLTQILLVMCQSQVSISQLKIYIYWSPTSFPTLYQLLPHTWAIVIDSIMI